MRYSRSKLTRVVKRAVMLTRPAGNEAKAEARKSEAEDDAEAQNFFRGRGQTR